MKADLHTHTTASDGTLEPAALVRAAVGAGVSMLSITDHDTTGAYARDEVARAASAAGITLVRGIELSAGWNRRGVHVVGLQVEPEAAAMRHAETMLRSVRRERAERIGAKLARLGFADALEGARRLAGDGETGRPHFARHLVSIGAVETFADAFDRYLGAGKRAAVRERWPELADVVAWIREAGGTAVLAHPAKYDLTRTKLDELTAAFRSAGGAALEVVCGRQVPAVTRTLAELAGAHGLAGSTGSDFHVPDQAWAALGRAAPVPASVRPVWDLW